MAMGKVLIERKRWRKKWVTGRVRLRQTACVHEDETWVSALMLSGTSLRQLLTPPKLLKRLLVVPVAMVDAPEALTVLKGQRYPKTRGSDSKNSPVDGTSPLDGGEVTSTDNALRAWTPLVRS